MPTTTDIPPSGLELHPDLPVCQTDLPLDWYQQELRPYAEEFQALPDRRPETILRWMDRYVVPAKEHFGDSLLLLAHFYMGGEIVKLIEHYGGAISDSYALALQARNRPEKKVIVESAVHFMAESIAILAHDDQSVWITNPKAGCTMEMLAKDWMVEPVADQLLERYGDDLTVIAYMNTSGRIKALSGRTKGATCTSSNAHLVVDWARRQGKKILFVPDQHLGRNTAHALGMDQARLFALPDPRQGAIDVERYTTELDAAEMILWGSACGVHTVLKPRQVEYWQSKGYRVLVHPECTLETVLAADGSGSTNYLWDAVMRAEPGTKLAIGTEAHFVRNAREQGAARGVEIVHLADVPEPGYDSIGCGCATMSRNDPPHLVGTLDLLRRGEAPEICRVLPGDAVDERTMGRDRLSEAERAQLVREARASLEQMISIVESKA
ncbi:quinolinate synthase NadA [Engelhardtia mirabilis]|uniref:quinolinate synthase n=1 Tax=Engelhardtia mirabilis TaxID=2528011 RepID=A0A518BLY9_9BACT|nr:Quinolinate synthase A [Planctomycetes bacterium Pla133]QDV02325.1 Quinolinate synthase A [Planctomycetes bacterium Pla86]